MNLAVLHSLCYQREVLPLTNDCLLQVYKNSPGDVLSSSSLTEEGVEGIISSSQSFITGHLSIRLDPMLQTIEFPACIANLDTGLTHIDGDTLTLWRKMCYVNGVPLKKKTLTHHFITKIIKSYYYAQ